MYKGEVNITLSCIKLFFFSKLIIFFRLGTGKNLFCAWMPSSPWDILVYVPSEQEDRLWLNALKIEETTKIRDNRVCALHLIFNK